MVADEPLKPIRLSTHAAEQCVERGATEAEVRYAIQHGVREAAKHGRWLFRHNFQYNSKWQGRVYAIKQVVPIVAESVAEIAVVTVYTFYF
jgi:hypothetical protein